MQSSSTRPDRILFRTLWARVLLFCALLLAVQSGPLTALYILTNTNVAYMLPVLSDLVPILTETLDLVSIVIGYAGLLFALYRFPSRSAAFGWLFLGLTAGKYLLRVLVSILLDGQIGRDFLLTYGFGYGVPLLLELLQFLLLWLVAHAILAKARRAERSVDPDAFYPDRALCFPFRRLLSLRNPLQAAALVAALLVWLSKILNLLAYDISYGLPTSLADLLWIVAYYLLYTLVGAMSYLGLLYLFLLFDQRDRMLREFADLPKAPARGLFLRANRRIREEYRRKDR